MTAAVRGAGTVLGVAKSIAQQFDYVTFELNVYSLGGAGGDQLTVWIQQQVDGTNWEDVVAYAIVNGNYTGPGGWLCTLPVRKRDLGGELHAVTDGTMTAGTFRDGLLGRTFRARCLVAGISPAFGFQVLAFPRSLL